MLVEFFKHIFIFNKIVIIGYPDSGKSALFKEIITKPEAKEYFVFQTDSYKEIYEYKEQLYKIIDLLKDKEKYIIEGIMGYRFVRKIAQNKKVFPLVAGSMEPDLIIICKTDRRPQDKHLSTRKGLDTVWKKYLEIEKNLPKIIKYEN